MDEKVLKVVTPIIFVLTIAFFAVFRYMPTLHEKYALIVEKRDRLFENWQTASVSQENLNEIVEAEEGQSSQLNIEIPPGISEDDKDGDDGVIELNLDRIYELKTDVADQKLAMDFIDPHDIYDKVIVVDAGHGSRAAGATKKGVMEKEINLQIVLQLKKLFDESDQNIKVYYTRTEDTNPTLMQRVELANLCDADLFISVHNNSSSSGNFSSLSGTQVMYSQSDDSELSSKKLAQICLDNVSDTLGSRKRGLLKGDNIYIIRSSEVPVALIEVGFMTNRDELENLVSEDYQQKAAQGIYNAVMEAFEEGY